MYVEDDPQREAPALQHQEMVRLYARRRAPFVDEVHQSQRNHRAERESYAAGHQCG